MNSFHCILPVRIALRHTSYMLGIRIPVCWDPDLFIQIQILERALAVRSKLDSRVVACSSLWTVALKRQIFKRKKGSRTFV
jgi:hypothetical protein